MCCQSRPVSTPTREHKALAARDNLLLSRLQHDTTWRARSFVHRTYFPLLRRGRRHREHHPLPAHGSAGLAAASPNRWWLTPPPTSGLGAPWQGKVSATPHRCRRTSRCCPSYRALRVSPSSSWSRAPPSGSRRQRQHQHRCQCSSPSGAWGTLLIQWPGQEHFFAGWGCEQCPAGGGVEQAGLGHPGARCCGVHSQQQSEHGGRGYGWPVAGSGAAGLSRVTTDDLLRVNTTPEAVDGLAACDGAISRLGVGLEATRPVPLANGNGLQSGSSSHHNTHHH